MTDRFSKRCMLRAGAAVLAAVLLPLSFAAAQDAGFVRDFELEPEAYLGLWYEVARTPNDFEDNQPVQDGVTYGPCIGSTATYDSLPFDRISIFNACTREAVDGSGAVFHEEIEGVGRIQPDTDGRKLKIAFGNFFVRFLTRLFTGGGADYWVFGLGPQGTDGRYEWALVSGESRDFIFVLAREPEIDDATLAEIIELAEAEGLPTDALIFTQP